MSIHTCPRCELCFEREAEVLDHLRTDHRVDPDAPRRAIRRVVVVGNHTLLADALRDRLVAVAAEGPAEVHVVVPVQHDADLDIGFWRGRALAERIVADGVDLTVDVGVADPVALVERALHGGGADLVLVSTLPAGISRWLNQDLPSRLRHALGAPVEVVTAEG